MSMTFAEFAAANKARCESKDGFEHPISSWSLSDWMVALAGEVGEAADIVKKLNRIRDNVGTRRTKNTVETERDLRILLAYEIADIMSYLDLFTQAAGVNLEVATILKWNMVSADIGYPVMLPESI